MGDVEPVPSFLKWNLMKEIIYRINNILISGLLFVLMLLVIEAGYGIGASDLGSGDVAFQAHVGSITTALIGILALLLGFTFSLSLQRFDNRSVAVVDEANAIRTAHLRSQLLPSVICEDVQKLMREYLDIRIQESTITPVDQAGRELLLAKASDRQAALWSYAQQVAEQVPNPVISFLFIQSLNEIVETYNRRNAVLKRRVPEVVLLLLFGTFLMTGAAVGYSSGVASHHPSFITYIMVGLIVILVFIIMDLDRPRRGIIKVSPESLMDLQAIINVDARAGG
jgi:hypothetical protein